MEMKKAITYGAETKYEQLNELGKGSFAEVFLVERLPDRKKFVAKITRNEDYFEMAKDEAKSLKMFGNKHIVAYIESFPYDDRGKSIFVIILEYCDGGTLTDFIKKYGGKKEHAKNFLRIA